MGYWTDVSIEFANQRNYLDELFKVYPTIPEGIRDIDERQWNQIEDSFNAKDNVNLIIHLLHMDLFPIKDSYVAYLKRDPDSIKRNPNTVNRLCGRLYEMGLDKIFEKCSEPKETNRQIGPLFKRWLGNGGLGIRPVGIDRFQGSKENAVLDASDSEMKEWCSRNLNYSRDKGLDFVGRFNGRYVIGEAKFLTDFGGHQNAQFADAISTIKTPSIKAIPIAILDGVLYIKTNNKMFRDITTTYSDCNRVVRKLQFQNKFLLKTHFYRALARKNARLVWELMGFPNKSNIFSALVLREFLYSL